MVVLSLTYPFIHSTFFHSNGGDVLAGAGSNIGGMPANLKSCSVVKIYDGDTMTLRCPEKVKVRMHCIDTPEMKQAPWGKISRDNLRDKSPSTVFLDAKTKDRYGRTVGEVYTQDGLSLNLYQVQSGAANVYARYCSDKRFFSAVEVAKQSGIGIWAETGLHQTPWEYRRK